MPGLLELGRVIIGRDEAQAAVEHEGRFSHPPHQFAACTVVEPSARMVTLERQTGQLIERSLECLHLRGLVTTRAASLHFHDGALGIGNSGTSVYVPSDRATPTPT